MSIRFGVCATFDKIPVLISAGYDQLEFGLKNLVNMSDAEFEAALVRSVLTGKAMALVRECAEITEK